MVSKCISQLWFFKSLEISDNFISIGRELSVTLNLDIDHKAEFDGWQYVVEGDIYYAEENSIKEEQRSGSCLKQ